MVGSQLTRHMYPSKFKTFNKVTKNKLEELVYEIFDVSGINIFVNENPF